MVLEHFNSLTKYEQQDLLLKQGIYVAERFDGPFRIMLYQLDGFYVEVYFFNLYNKVAYFLGYDTTDVLEPYLAQIDVSDVLQEALS